MGLGIPQNSSHHQSSIYSSVLFWKSPCAANLTAFFQLKTLFRAKHCLIISILFWNLLYVTSWKGFWQFGLPLNWGTLTEKPRGCKLWNERDLFTLKWEKGRNGEEIVTAGMRDKLNIECHPLFGGVGYLMLKNFAAYFIKTSILNKNSIKSINDIQQNHWKLFHE